MEQENSNSSTQGDNPKPKKIWSEDKAKYRLYRHDDIMAGKAISVKRDKRYIVSGKMLDGTEIVIILYENKTNFPTSIMRGTCLTRDQMRQIKRDKRRLP